MKKRMSLLIVLFASIKLYASNTYAFFGSFNRDKKAEGIQVFKLDTVSGALSKLTGIKGLSNPSYLALSPNGEYIFACTESKTPHAGSVTSFRFDPIKKTLNILNSQRSSGENPVYLSIHKNGKWLVNSSYTEGSISVYPIAEDGSINTASQNLQFTEGSIYPERQDRSHIHAAVFAPDFEYIFFPDLGADKIRCYRFDTGNAKPLQQSKIPFTLTVPGSGPRHFTFHPNGAFAYCIEELSGTVSVYQYKEGSLDRIQRVPTHPVGPGTGYESSDIHISPDGRYLYASNRGRENNIAIFSIQEDGKLTIVGYQPALGEHPRIFAIDESGKFLIVTNAISGNVFVFKRDLETGLLSKVGKELKIRNVSCVQIRRY